MPKGAQFEQELADLWEWLVRGQEVEEEGYLPHSISHQCWLEISALAVSVSDAYLKTIQRQLGSY